MSISNPSYNQVFSNASPLQNGASFSAVILQQNRDCTIQRVGHPSQGIYWIQILPHDPRNFLLSKWNFNHPSILDIHEDAEGGRVFVAEDMQFTLKQFLQTRPSKSTILSLMKQIAAFVDYLHSQGIAHTEISHDCFLIRFDGTMKALPFKNSGIVVYTTPERIVNSPEIDMKKEDMFQLGCLFYEILVSDSSEQSLPLQSEDHDEVQQMILYSKLLGRPKESLYKEIYSLLPSDSSYQLKAVLLQADTPVPLIRIVEKILLFNPSKRVNINQIKAELSSIKLPSEQSNRIRAIQSAKRRESLQAKSVPLQQQMPQDESVVVSSKMSSNDVYQPQQDKQPIALNDDLVSRIPENQSEYQSENKENAGAANEPAEYSQHITSNKNKIDFQRKYSSSNQLDQWQQRVQERNLKKLEEQWELLQKEEQELKKEMKLQAEVADDDESPIKAFIAKEAPTIFRDTKTIMVSKQNKQNQQDDGRLEKKLQEFEDLKTTIARENSASMNQQQQLPSFFANPKFIREDKIGYVDQRQKIGSSNVQPQMQKEQNQKQYYYPEHDEYIHSHSRYQSDTTDPSKHHQLPQQYFKSQVDRSDQENGTLQQETYEHKSELAREKWHKLMDRGAAVEEVEAEDSMQSNHQNQSDLPFQVTPQAQRNNESRLSHNSTAEVQREDRRIQYIEESMNKRSNLKSKVNEISRIDQLIEQERSKIAKLLDTINQKNSIERKTVANNEEKLRKELESEQDRILQLEQYIQEQEKQKQNLSKHNMEIKNNHTSKHEIGSQGQQNQHINDNFESLKQRLLDEQKRKEQNLINEIKKRDEEIAELSRKQISDEQRRAEELRINELIEMRVKQELDKNRQEQIKANLMSDEINKIKHNKESEERVAEYEREKQREREIQKQVIQQDHFPLTPILSTQIEQRHLPIRSNLQIRSSEHRSQPPSTLGEERMKKPTTILRNNTKSIAHADSTMSSLHQQEIDFNDNYTQRQVSFNQHVKPHFSRRRPSRPSVQIYDGEMSLDNHQGNQQQQNVVSAEKATVPQLSFANMQKQQQQFGLPELPIIKSVNEQLQHVKLQSQQATSRVSLTARNRDRQSLSRQSSQLPSLERDQKNQSTNLARGIKYLSKKASQYQQNQQQQMQQPQNQNNIRNAQRNGMVPIIQKRSTSSDHTPRTRHYIIQATND